MKIQSQKTLLPDKKYYLYIVPIIIACVSLILTNFSYDAEYQMAMAYRMIKGDTMIAQMWEPHQTSAFLCAIIMKLYMTVTKTTTGIVLFTQFIGFLMRTGISLYLYRTIRRLTDVIPALVAAIMYLLISPKDLLIPEFSNMQLWFGTLMALTLIQYLEECKVRHLILSAICLCLGVLSYPSFVIAYVAAFFLLLRYSNSKKRDLLIYTATCALIGGTFIAYLLTQVGLETILDCLPRALAIEPTHTISMSEKLLQHLLNIGKMLFVPICALAIGSLVERFISFKKKFDKDRLFLWTWYGLMLYLLVNILLVENNGAISYPLLGLLILGFLKRNLLTVAEQKAYYIALTIGFMNLFCTMLLSDHAVLWAVPYMHVAVCFSVVPLYRWYDTCKVNTSFRKMFFCAVHVFLLITIFRSIFIHVPISGRGQICSLASDLAVIRSGPAIGLITNEEGAALHRDSMAEWKLYIKPGDTIWILGDPVDTLGYLYEDVEVGAPTVMSTPTYNEQLLYYWEVNPDKYPDVVIMASGFGELSWDLRKNDWLMDWIENEYPAETVIDGNYWRYYIRN